MTESAVRRENNPLWRTCVPGIHRSCSVKAGQPPDSSTPRRRHPLERELAVEALSPLLLGSELILQGLFLQGTPGKGEIRGSH